MHGRRVARAQGSRVARSPGSQGRKVARLQGCNVAWVARDQGQKGVGSQSDKPMKL